MAHITPFYPRLVGCSTERGPPQGVRHIAEEGDIKVLEGHPPSECNTITITTLSLPLLLLGHTHTGMNHVDGFIVFFVVSFGFPKEDSSVIRTGEIGL